MNNEHRGQHHYFICPIGWNFHGASERAAFSLSPRFPRVSSPFSLLQMHTLEARCVNIITTPIIPLSIPCLFARLPCCRRALVTTVPLVAAAHRPATGLLVPQFSRCYPTPPDCNC